MTPSYHEIDIFTRTIWGEARNQFYTGQVAVAWVIKNRSIIRNQTISTVCQAPKQFSCWDIKDINYTKLLATNLDSPSFIKAFGIACLVYTNDIKDPTKGADHYHTVNRPVNVNPWPPTWAKNMVETVIIEDHRFLRSYNV